MSLPDKVVVVLPGWEMRFKRSDAAEWREHVEHSVDELVRRGEVSPVDRDRYVEAARVQCIEQGCAWDRRLAS